MTVTFQELLSAYIKLTPNHKGKGRLVSYWMKHRDRSSGGCATLPGGARIRCSLGCDYDSMVYLGQEETVELHWLISRLGAGDWFVDCGANIGLWTLVAAARVGETGHVISYEPNPNTAQRLKENIRLNGMEPIVSIVEAAVGEAPGVARFDTGDAHNLGHLDIAGNLEVPLVTLDSLTTETEIAGIKLDIEGAELAALMGASRLIREDQPWVMVEFNTIISGQIRIEDWDVYQFLKAAGYKAFESGPDGLWATPINPGWQTSGYKNILFEPDTTSSLDIIA